MKKLKEKVLQAAEIAKECPENLQTICFEILLKHLLSSSREEKAPPEKPREKVQEEVKREPESIVEETAMKQDDLLDSDVHVKARKFLDKHGLTLENLNQLFYKEESRILPLYDDLKTTMTSESQVRITLLQCLQSAIQSGDFETTVEATRTETKMRKCYDNNNWANNYTNNAMLFDFEKYSKNVKAIKLSDQGKTELADLINELQ